MAREIMTTADVARHFQCTARVAREYMREIGLVQIGHGYVYRDALERYEAVRTKETAYTLPVLQEGFQVHPVKRYPRPKKGG